MKNMRIKFLILIIFININYLLRSQFTVSLTANKTSACVDDEIQFIAKTINSGVEEAGVKYTWSFGDGSIAQSGINLDTITHKFKKGRGYIVKVEAEKGDNKTYALKRINISVKPNFHGTKSNRDKPVCLGQMIHLTGKFQPVTWTYKPEIENMETSPVFVSNSQNYISKFDFRAFKKQLKITSDNYIDSVGIKIEHNDIGNLKIELISPEGASLLLKDFGSLSGKHFGEPNPSNTDSVGTAYYYYWTNNARNGKMKDANPSGNSLKQGAYKPEEQFSKLTGSSLNGLWQIKISSKKVESQGFVHACKLVVKGETFFTNWQYTNTYNNSSNRPEWLGSGVSSTSDLSLATAVPETYGNQRYTYRVTDDFSCRHDTSIINNVEAASFKTMPDSASGPFDLNIKFKSTTSWLKSAEWNFGDRSPLSYKVAPEHIYTRQGKYLVLFTAKSDDGCSDTASIIVKVTIPPSSLDEIPNAFTPNGDGINDFFKLRKGSAIETLSCHIYNRWGKRVALWTSVSDATEKGWDGKVPEGGKAAPGVYFYILKAVGFDGKVYDKSGSFHLFR